MSQDKTGLLMAQQEYLKEVTLFKGLSDAQLESMISVMGVKKIADKDYIMREGANSTDIYILLEGEIEISKSLVLPQWIQSAQKQEKSLIVLSEKYHPFFGEMSMFGTDSTREASIRAIRPCTIAFLTKEKLIREIEKEPAIGKIIYHNIASELVKRLRKANKDILKLTTAFTLALEG